MGETNINGYIPPFISSNLPWYERDGLTNSVEYYKTINKNDFNNYDKKEKEKALAATACCKRFMVIKI